MQTTVQASIHLEDEMAIEVFVRPSEVPGDLLGGDGSEANPYHSVQRGVTEASNNGGRTVYRHGGHFVESIGLTDVSAPGELNSILCARSRAAARSSIIRAVPSSSALPKRTNGSTWTPRLPRLITAHPRRQRYRRLVIATAQRLLAGPMSIWLTWWKPPPYPPEPGEPPASRETSTSTRRRAHST